MTILRDMDIKISENMHRRFIDKLPLIVKKKEKKVIKPVENLKRVLLITNDQFTKNDLASNLYNVFEDNDYDVRIEIPCNFKVAPNELHLEKGMYYPINRILNKSKWKPQLIIINEKTLNFSNNQIIPVFYFHDGFERYPSVFYPTVAFFWHEDIVKYYERVAREWMSQVQCKEVIELAFDSKSFLKKFNEYKKIGEKNYSMVKEFEIDEIINIHNEITLKKKS